MKNTLLFLFALLLMGTGCTSVEQMVLDQNEDNESTLPYEGHTPDETELICYYEDQIIFVGQSYYDGCNTHTCQYDGTIISTEIGCGSEITNLTTISGVVTVGKFTGTEMGCEFSEDAEVGDRLTCNNGTVNLGVTSNKYSSTIWLKDYICNAVEIFTKTTDGIDVSYEVSGCTSDMIPGNDYSLGGELEQKLNQWYMGVQQDEWWFSVN